ncbi:APC family permease [Streptomyces sp. NRRL WC-3618]|uniref:APC family permease n=1 Tax=Streptomyces sp. NRRL WC-3618 TaxID=1519490 RepID=UPI0006ADE5AE|nr:APC family permease [Streptomyces sp. NRRL WC-3618]
MHKAFGKHFLTFLVCFVFRHHFSRVVAFETASDKNMFLAVSTATSLAFFAMVGFEDSVNMAPARDFPRMMFTGLGITGLIYVLVSVCAVAVVPVGQLASSETPLVTVVQTAAPDFPISDALPFISMFAVANSALINMMMASRLLYGMGRQGVLPPFLAQAHVVRRTPQTAILFTTAIAFGLITFVSLNPDSPVVALLGGTASLLLLTVFAGVHVAVLVLRRDRVEAPHFRPADCCPWWERSPASTWSSGRPADQYRIAGILLLIGVAMWAVARFARRGDSVPGAGQPDKTAPH